MKWALAIAFLISASPIVMFAGCRGGQAHEMPLEPPSRLSAVHHSENGISYLRWDSPLYEVSDYEVEWRFADVPHWTPLSGLEISNSPAPGDQSIEARGNSLTRGYGVQYCYRVRAHTASERRSEWSAEACAVHGNYWWTVPAGNPPGYIFDLLLRNTGPGIEFTWQLETINSITGDTTSGVEVWRREEGSAAYETVGTLPPEPLSPQDMKFVDPGAAGGSYCYRLAVVSSLGGHRLLDEVCPTPAPS